MLLKTIESENFPKLKRLCPPNSVVMYTSFHKIFREILCCKVFGWFSLSNMVLKIKLMQQNISLFFLSSRLSGCWSKQETNCGCCHHLIVSHTWENFDCPPVSVLWPLHVHVMILVHVHVFVIQPLSIPYIGLFLRY